MLHVIFVFQIIQGVLNWAVEWLKLEDQACEQEFPCFALQQHCLCRMPKLFEEQCANKWGFRLNPTETATLTQAKLHIFVKKTIESHLIARFLAHLQSSDYSCIKNSLDVLSKTIKVASILADPEALEG